MPKSSDKVIDAEVVSSPAPAGDDLLRALMGQIDDLSSELGELRAAQQTIEQRTPRTIETQAMPSRPPTVDTVQELYGIDQQTGENAAGLAGKVATGPRGLKIDDLVMSAYPPQFGVGSSVRINPESRRPQFFKVERVMREARDGSKYPLWEKVLPEEKWPWRDVLGATTPQLDPDTVLGQVVERRYIRDVGVWKYKVRFAGFTPPQGDGFDEPELIAA